MKKVKNDGAPTRGPSTNNPVAMLTISKEGKSPESMASNL